MEDNKNTADNPPEEPAKTAAQNLDTLIKTAKLYKLWPGLYATCLRAITLIENKYPDIAKKLYLEIYAWRCKHIKAMKSPDSRVLLEAIADAKYLIEYGHPELQKEAKSDLEWFETAYKNFHSSGSNSQES